jgi:hypothetical protein
MNGLRRCYLPKGVSFPCEEMDHAYGSVEWRRNATGARSRLNGCRTPAEVARESRERSV